MSFAFCKRGLLFLSIFVLVSCATVPKGVDHFKQYKQHLDNASNPDHLMLAKKSLEAAIEEYANTDLGDSLIKLMTINLSVGKFGYFSEKEYRYWYQRMGNDQTLGMKYEFQTLEMINKLYRDTPESVVSWYSKAKEYCNDTSLLTSLDEEVGLKVRAALDCVLENIASEKQAQQLYAYKLQFFDPRENAKKKAQGFELLADGRSELSALSNEQQEALYMAYVQIYSVNHNIDAPRLKDVVPVGYYEQLKPYISLSSSGNREDRIKANDAAKKLLENPTIPGKHRAGLLYMFIVSSSNADDYQDVLYFISEFRDLPESKEKNAEEFLSYTESQALSGLGKTKQAISILRHKL
ncbi:hypothetical protein [Pleionea sp. CnH1-48]|uniref:hypothetical protein n=1 Tax=Pleionea sp. CnH1-48 TaxID=2954494 RepID=UPI00209726FA|nr:hypothetical protein [Pleionea sp. CnH1-48]MCO7223687.1 hypothetical protein [Pleionea sp. CnH1-48]